MSKPLVFKKALVFKRIAHGLYINHEHHMVIEHEVSWSASEGRKWIAEWMESGMWGLMTPTKRRKKFDSITKARAFLNDLIWKETR